MPDPNTELPGKLLHLNVPKKHDYLQKLSHYVFLPLNLLLCALSSGYWCVLNLSLVPKKEVPRLSWQLAQMWGRRVIRRGEV